MRLEVNDINQAKPFLKWAGGKSQLLDNIREYYPFNDKITKYAEPFLGSGAVLFDILNKFKLDSVYISDINKELINSYIVIRDNIDDIIEILYNKQELYHSTTGEKRRELYFKERDKFNTLKKSEGNKIERAALMIFLNRTCFNGLYRENKKGEFNVPIGSYKKPLICDEKNLRNVSLKLQNSNIICADYKMVFRELSDETFVYFDPPYRPISNTSSFNSYNSSGFNDEDQVELAELIKKADSVGAKFVLSNSDPKNHDENDNFFDDLYSGFSIYRVDAKRSINSNSKKRGNIKEILVTNL